MLLRIPALMLLTAFGLLSGCSMLRDYDRELQQITEQLSTGNIDDALLQLERNNWQADKDLLYYFEKGELLRAKGDFIGSQLTWRQADRQVFQWEESTKFDFAKYLAIYDSYAFNDKVRRYEGYDYEKVMLTTQMALNLLALGDFEGARTEIKKTHEREDVIAALRDKEYFQLEEDAKAQGINLHFKELQGYPVTSLDAPEVLALKNSYQSAFSHYLAGFVYEALGERALAAPGYRHAIELHPHTPLLEQALLNLGKPLGKAGESDVLIVVQNGLAPARGSVRVPMLMEIDGEKIPTNMSFPVILANASVDLSTQIRIDGRQHPLTALSSTNVMSRRALRDDMPAIIFRTTFRARMTAREIAFKRKNDPARAEEYALYRARVEDADTRTWRTLPDTTSVLRLRLKRGEHMLSLPDGPPFRITINQDYQVVGVRLLRNQIFMGGAAAGN